MSTRIPDGLDFVLQKESTWWKDLFLIVLGSILITVCAPISVKLPFTPIPIALASHLCLALSVVLGSKRGSLAVFMYLLQGLMGFPVFALGQSGLSHLMGPTGGYLLGYVAATYITGYLVEQIRGKAPHHLFLALVVGSLIIYLFGVCQLSLFVGFKSAVMMGMLPFLLGDLLKVVLVYKGVKRFL